MRRAICEHAHGNADELSDTVGDSVQQRKPTTEWIIEQEDKLSKGECCVEFVQKYNKPTMPAEDATDGYYASFTADTFFFAWIQQ